MHSYADVIEMKRANVRNYALMIRSLRASPAFKCECETSSTLSSYIFFSPRRFKGGVNGEFPNNIRANNIETKSVSNNKNEMRLSKHKNKIVYEKVLVVKSIHNSKDSLRKAWKLQMKFSEFDCLTGYSVLFLLFEIHFIFSRRFS